MLLRLPFLGPYDWSLALRMIAAHAVPGAERIDDDGESYTRLMDGPAGPQPVTVRPEDGAVVVETIGDATAEDLAARVRHWLDWTSIRPPRWTSSLLTKPSVRSSTSGQGLRRIRYPETFEAVVSTVLGQQVSLAAARTFAGRLTSAYGRPDPQGLTAFPRPERVAAIPLDELQSTLGITGARTRTVGVVARLFAESVDWPVPLPADEWDSRAAQLQALPGIGPWTVGYLRMRLFGDPDAVPVGDLVLRRALGLTRNRDVGPAMERWRPERTYATFQLWASTAW